MAEDTKKLIDNIAKDLELVSKTAVALAQKLDSLSRNMNELFSRMDIDTQVGRTPVTTTSTPAATTTSSDSGQAAQTAQTTQTATKWDNKMSSQGVIATINKLGKLINDNADPEMIGNEMEKARDILMSIAQKSSPVFAEIGRRARQLQNLKVLDENTKKELLETLINWRTRLSE